MFLTNNSSHNANFYVQKLAKMGLSIDRSKVMTSGEATCEKLGELYPGKRCFVLGNEYLKAEFAEAGIAVDEENPEVVVIGFDTTLDYQKMWKVCDFVRAGLPYVATHPDFNCPTETGFMPDTARSSRLSRPRPAAARTRSAASRTPASSRPCCAAPGCSLASWRWLATGCTPTSKPAAAAGMLSILVMSGETTEEMLAQSETKPDLKFGRLSDMIPLL